jgi:hypothetical protein
MAKSVKGSGEQAEDSVEAKRRFGWMSLSLSAFVMSLTATLINVFYAVQGSEIVIQPPRQVLLYRDGEGENSVLSVAMRLELINTSSNYGDVLLGMEISPRPGAPGFVQEGLAQLAFTEDGHAQAANCELGAHCTGHPGLLVIQRSDNIMDLPAGAARALTPYFWLVDATCKGPREQCGGHSDFDRSVEALSRQPLEMRLRVKLQNDGEREILCRGGKIDAAYLREIGWTQLACTQASVSGDTLF